MLISFSPNFFKNCGEKVLDEIFSLNTVCDKISFFFDQSLSNDTTLKACIENTNINTGFLEQYKDKEIDLIFVFGGDGSLLWLNKHIKEFDGNAFIFAFNFGHVGFLTKFVSDEVKDVIDCLKLIISGKDPDKQLTYTSIPLLKSEIKDKDGKVVAGFLSINEMIVERSNNYSNWLDIHIDGEFVLSINADGFIIATQQGSSCYNASIGGPFLFPGSDSFIISAVAPFAINFRSLVLNSKSIVTFSISERNYGDKVKVSSDSNDTQFLTKGSKLDITMGDKTLNLVQWKQDQKKIWIEKIASLYKWR